MEGKTIVFNYKKDSINYHKYVLMSKEVIGNIYIAKDIVEKAPESIQVTIQENTNADKTITQHDIRPA